MKPPVVAVSVVAVALVLFVFGAGGDRGAGAPAAPTATTVGSDEENRTDSDGGVEAPIVGGDSSSEVRSDLARHSNDPCSALEAERDRLADLLKQERQKNARLERDVRLATLASEHLETTPFGEVLRSHEASSFTDAELSQLGLILSEYPVHLLPGEATGIIEKMRESGWPSGRETERWIIDYLGPQRFLVEVPDEWIEENAPFYEDEAWLELFGSAKPVLGEE